MSKIYSNTQFICSCTTSNLTSAEESSKSRKYLFTEHRSFPLHLLPNLYICTSCLDLKCTSCLTPKYESKFCPSCMTDHTDVKSTFCTKNCFDCPDCSSRTIITSKTIPPRSKQFTFTCTFCTYSYTTGVIDKPMSLLSILRSENRANNPEAAAFHQFQSKVRAIVSYNKLMATETGPPSGSRKITPELLAKLTNLNLTNLKKKLTNSDNVTELEKLQNQIDTINAVPFDQDEDEEELTRRLNSDTTSSLQKSIYQRSLNFPFQDLPIPKSLRVKKSLTCTKCATAVVVPDPLPILLKFPVKYNAVDFVPTVKVTPLPTSTIVGSVAYPLLINLMNPLGHLCSVKISTVSQVPTQLLSNSSVVVNITLPTASTVALAPKSDSKKESIVKGIPTSYLTTTTQASRAELMLRQASPTDVNASYIEDSFDESFDTTIPLETGASWGQVLMKLTVIGSVGESFDAKIPLHFVLHSTTDGNHPLKLTYWTVVDLGKVQIAAP